TLPTGLPPAHRSRFTVYRAGHCGYTSALYPQKIKDVADISGRKVVLGVTGGIAAYKAAELTRELVRGGFDVQVVMTEAARGFVPAEPFQAFPANPVYTSMWNNRIRDNMAHIELPRGKDAIIVAPATADFIAKLAHGLADDLLSTLCLARAPECPLLV